MPGFEPLGPERLGDDHPDLDEVLELKAAGGQRSGIESCEGELHDCTGRSLR